MKFRHFIWIICLSFLSVGARNFENGLSLDAPLYATISRNIINSGEWFHLDPFLNEFKPYYAEHPHLGFWIQAIIFKAVGAADWSARISGHLYYLAFMCLFFFALMSISGEIVATLAVLLLWVLAPFANFFSSFFLDPGCLFWGSCFLFSLWKSVNNYSFKWAFLSGLSLALSFMTKGLTILAFGPAAVFILFSQRKTK
jgi:4-amino-4-deoxy-L-arabinose transferase-like glycosyltransferase